MVRGSSGKLILIASLILGGTLAARAQDARSTQPTIESRQEAELARLEAVANVATGDALYAALCDGAGVAFDLAEPEGNKRSSDFAQKGLALSKRARELHPERALAHYRFALCLGIYLREHPLYGIKRAKELVEVGEIAASIDGTIDHGGPHRFLAIVYAEAPRFLGPGDRDKARAHLRELMRIDGDDENNKLAAARVLILLDEKDQARAMLDRVHPEKSNDEATRRSLTAERDHLRAKVEAD